MRIDSVTISYRLNGRIVFKIVRWKSPSNLCAPHYLLGHQRRSGIWVNYIVSIKYFTNTKILKCNYVI